MSLPAIIRASVEDGFDEQDLFHRVAELAVDLGNELFFVFAILKTLPQTLQPGLGMATDGFALAEGGHGDLVDGCAEGVVVGVADRNHAIGLVEHQHLFRSAVGDEKRGVGADQHLLTVAAVKTLVQTGDEVGPPVRVEMGLRLVEQKQVLGVLEKQAEAQGVEQLVLAVG